MVRVRQDVWDLSLETPTAAATQEWHPVLDAYARGVHAMRALDGQGSVDSWEWAANTHGAPPGTPHQPLWSQCEHGKKFFLPWHRAYLAWFEATVQRLTGEADWALPYWDYTDPQRPERLDLPPEFRVERRTVNGESVLNPLFAASRDGTPRADNVEIAEAMAARLFVEIVPNLAFGGSVGTADYPGFLEMEPHNLVHGDIGGLMGFPSTAAQDPIFWLHHANIDRLWEVWRQLPHAIELPQQSDLPPGVLSEWNSATFEFGRAGEVSSYTVGQVQDSTAPPLDYRYDTVELSPTLQALIGDIEGGGPMGLDDASEPGRWAPVAAQASVDVGPAGQSVDLDLGARPMGLDDLVPPSGIAIELAGVHGAEPHRVYLVEVSVDPGGPRRRAGRFSTFGVGDEGDRDTRGYLVDASNVVPALEEDGWEGGTLSVHVTPDPDQGPAGARVESGIRIDQITVYLR